MAFMDRYLDVGLCGTFSVKCDRYMIDSKEGQYVNIKPANTNLLVLSNYFKCDYAL